MDKKAQEKIGKYWCEHSLMQIPWDNVKGEMRETILEHAQEILNELRKLGYRKLPDKPPLLLAPTWFNFPESIPLEVVSKNMETQREADIKHYTE